MKWLKSWHAFQMADIKLWGITSFRSKCDVVVKELSELHGHVGETLLAQLLLKRRLVHRCGHHSWTDVHLWQNVFPPRILFRSYLAWLMLKLIAVCRSSHSPHFDGRGSPVSTIGAGSPIHCRRISQIVTFPIQPSHVVESTAIHNLAFANLYRFLLQLEPETLLIFFRP